MRRTLAVVLLVALATPAAAMMREVPLERLSAEADGVVRARVVSQAGHWTADRMRIATDVTCEVVEPWTGAMRAGDRFVVEVYGGRVGNLVYRTEHDPVFETGDEAVLFLKQGTDSRLHVWGAEQGRYRVDGASVVDWRGHHLATPALRIVVRNAAPTR